MHPLAFLHGFLGSPEDWSEIIDLLPEYECTALTYPFSPSRDATLVGYSMGGRIALQLPNPAIVISAHPGYVGQKPKQNHEWIDRLLPFPAFLEAWYAQPLFDTLRMHPNFPQIFARRLRVDPKIARAQLENHPLQPFSRKAAFIYGEHDTKYKNLYTHLSPICIERSGHACHLENPNGCADALRRLLGEGARL